MNEGSTLWLVVRAAVSLLAVLVLLLAFVRILERRGVGARRTGRRDVPVEVIARQALGRSASVQLVRVGGRVVLLGVTDTAVRVLTEMPAAEVETEAALGTARAAPQPRRSRGAARLASDRCCRREGRGVTVSDLLTTGAPEGRARRLLVLLGLALCAAALLWLHGASPAAGLTAAPISPTPPATPGAPDVPNLDIDISGGAGRSTSVTIILLLTVLSVAPAVLLLMTSFTKIIVVLALTRQAIGTPTIPPTQVLAGLALFLSLFVMAPVLTAAYDQGVQPYLDGALTQAVAFDRIVEPLRQFMLAHTGTNELQTMIALARDPQPAQPAEVDLTTLIPAFVISELRTAFIIGFVIYVPFLVIDLVVASILMSLGMMMLPPVMISLPFKLLLFIMVDGWTLITTALVTSYVPGGA